MTNIKISELDELQEVADQDLFVIVDSDKNITKKIQAGNLGILVPKTTKTTSDTETYSCNYVNNEVDKLLPENSKTTGTTNTYSCNYINGIVESGSNENGNWIKYNDGTMICTATKLFENVSVTNSWGNLYETSELSLGNFPQPFISTPVGLNCIMIANANTNGKGSAGFVEYIAQTTNTYWGKTAIVKPVSSAVSNIGLSLIAIGKWK